MVLLVFSMYFSELQFVDFFTKTQTRSHHQFYLFKFNVVDPP
jgi:hypothetical protein